MPTVDEYVGALNSAGVKPEQLASLLQIAGTQAEIEGIRTKEGELRKQREEAILAAVTPIDAQLQELYSLLEQKLALLEQLRKGGK